MKKTLQILNELVKNKILIEYAIAGGMAHFYYIEPSVTYDLDLIVSLAAVDNPLTPLNDLYMWANKNQLKTEGEHIVIAGIPVQFLLPYNDLVTEALANKLKVILFDEPTYILRAEYLMAIMLQTGRASDLERLTRFINESDYDKSKFNDIIQRFELLDKYDSFMKKING